jgi:hypothetical protein
LSQKKRKLILFRFVSMLITAFPKNQQNNENNQHQQGDQDEPNQRLSALECVKLFFTKGLNGMCFPMIEDDENENEEEQAREHAD